MDARRAERYAERIGLTHLPEATAAGLAALQEAHLRAVPFENLDIHAGRRIVLDEDHLFDKIVARGRGGFCYELNGLLFELLAALGYSVRRISARVYGAEGNLSPPYDHLALVVDCEGQWLVDVGFGDAFVAPLSLTTAEPARQRDREYRTTLDHGHLDYASKTPDGAWAPQYRFTLEARRWAEFEPRCAFHQTSPDSHFTQKRVVTRLTEAGRLTLRDERLIITEGARVTEVPIGSEAEWRKHLEARFGIDTP
ncbi:MAG: arylamine N-acetyltransferase [Myxococcales bacterium]|nr:arylamine N-acetyltransferase [Myxococcales bacterium]